MRLRGYFRKIELIYIAYAILLTSVSSYFYFQNIPIIATLLDWNIQTNRGEEVARVQSLIGDAKKISHFSNTVTFLAEGDVLHQSDTLITDSETNLLIEFLDSSVVKIGPNSMIKLKKPVERKLFKNQVAEIEILKGDADAVQISGGEKSVVKDENKGREVASSEDVKYASKQIPVVEFASPAFGEDFYIDLNSKSLKSLAVNWKTKTDVKYSYFLNVERRDLKKREYEGYKKYKYTDSNASGTKEFRELDEGEYRVSLILDEEGLPEKTLDQVRFFILKDHGKIEFLKAALNADFDGKNTFTNVEISWLPIEDAVGYTVLINGEEVKTNHTTFTKPLSKKVTLPIHYQVKSRLKSGREIASLEKEIHYKLSPPEPVLPRSGGIEIDDSEDGHLFFTWKLLKEAENYQFMIAEDSSFKSVVAKQKVNTNFVALKLKKGKTYYWKVKSTNSISESSYSEARKFVVR